MTAYRRTTWNYALDHALELALHLHKPLLIVETLSCGPRWASDRHHSFVLQGMADNAAACKATVARYYPYVEPRCGDAVELIAALAEHAAAIITDGYPINNFEDDTIKVAQRVAVRTESVDSNGLLPIWAADKVFSTAHAFRRFLQRALPNHLIEVPQAKPMARLKLPEFRGLPREITKQWPRASDKMLAADTSTLASLPIDHSVAVTRIAGGSQAASKRLQHFIKKKLASYPDDRSHPAVDGTSGLSPYLHFGHISVQEVFTKLAKSENWSPADLADTAGGNREGWWGMSAAAEAFLDELVTWREVGFNMCARRDDYDQYDSLPDWAQKTMAEHTADPREYIYSLQELETAATHDPLWNAAQTQLAREGRMHNYMRMLWGKKILQWSPSPHEALDIMIELNNKYALDGQDPNSYSGIFWVLGRYDRAWGPERPIFGKIRYMSSASAKRKLRLGSYVEDYSPVST
jgi:deoxyribodipyrimidine photo-lyase